MFVRGGPETEFEGSSHIGLAVGCQKRDQPALILDTASEAEAWSRENVSIDGDIILVPPLRYVARIECSVPEFDADSPLRTEPVICTKQFALRGPSNPAAD